MKKEMFLSESNFYSDIEDGNENDELVALVSRVK